MGVALLYEASVHILESPTSRAFIASQPSSTPVVLGKSSNLSDILLLIWKIRQQDQMFSKSPSNSYQV